MNEELGKIEKMPVDSYKQGRKLFFVPFLYSGKDMPEEYGVLIKKYWKQVSGQVTDLSAKLGAVNCLYHELITVAGDKGCKLAKEMNEEGYPLIQSCIDANAAMQAAEDADILSEFMDWSRCLYIGLQNQRVMHQVYDSYTAAAKKRNTLIASNIDASLGENQVGILILREDHQVQFPKDIQIFYVAPPALDEIKRWLREQESEMNRKQDDSGGSSS